MLPMPRNVGFASALGGGVLQPPAAFEAGFMEVMLREGLGCGGDAETS